MNLNFFRFTFHFLLQPLCLSQLIMNPGFQSNIPGFWDTHSYQMTNLNEAQDHYRPGQLFLRQRTPHKTFPPVTAVLAPFHPLQPAQAGCSGTGERKSQRDERKCAKSAKAPWKEQEGGDALFRESMKKLQDQGDKISCVLEPMEKKSSAAAPAHG